MERGVYHARPFKSQNTYSWTLLTRRKSLWFFMFFSNFIKYDASALTNKTSLLSLYTYISSLHHTQYSYSSNLAQKSNKNSNWFGFLLSIYLKTSNKPSIFSSIYNGNTLEGEIFLVSFNSHANNTKTTECAFLVTFSVPATLNKYQLYSH